MDAQPALDLSASLTAAPCASDAVVQPVLFGADASEPLSQGQAALVSGERGPGRPPGSQNKFKRDLARAVAHEFGGHHPLVGIARMVSKAIAGGLAQDKTNLDEISAVFGCTKRVEAGQVLQSLLGKVIEHTTPKLAQIKVQAEVAVPIVFGDLATEQLNDALRKVSEDLLDLGANDFKDLDSEGR